MPTTLITEQSRNDVELLAIVDQTAWTIDRFGIGGVDPEMLKRIVAAANERGTATVIGTIVCDQSAPRPARERAFGRLAQRLYAS